MSWLRFGRLGSILASSALKSTSVWPNFSPRPLNALAIAPRVSLSFAGSILSSTVDQLLEDGVDLDGDVLALEHLTLAQRLAGRVGRRRRVARTSRRTPSTTRCRRATLAGMSCSCVGSIARCRTAVPSGRVSMRLDLADLHAAHLDLGVGVHHQAGALRDHRHRNGFGRSRRGTGATASAKISDEHDDRGQARPAARTALLVIDSSPLSRQVEVAVGAVDGQRDQQRHRHDDDQRGAHRVAHRDTDAGGSAGGEVAVVGVDQQDRRSPSTPPAGTTTAGRSG